MAITTLDGLAAAVATSQDIVIQKASMTSAAGFWSSLWAEAGNPAAGSLSIGQTTNGAVPTDATAGAPLVGAFTGANTGYLASLGCVSTASGVAVLYDRVFHAGSFSCGALTTLSLTAQPSFSGRVPGSNWGEVEIWLEINTVMAATATTFAVNYQDGTAAGGAAQNTVTTASFSGFPTKRMVQLGMANGTGCQRINSITVGGATNTGTINVVCLRRLAMHNIQNANVGDPRQDFFRLGGQTVFADSCLALMWLGTGAASGNVFCDFQVANG